VAAFLMEQVQAGLRCRQKDRSRPSLDPAPYRIFQIPWIDFSSPGIGRAIEGDAGP